MDVVRALNILTRLRALTSELSKHEETSVSDTSEFRKLGFDASLLAELLKELTDELPTLSAIAEHGDRELLTGRLVPAEDLAADTSEGGSSLPIQIAACDRPGTHVARTDSAPEALPAVGVDGRAARIRDIMGKQIQVMANQIQLMHSLNCASPSVSTSANSPIAQTGTETSAAGDVAKAMEAVVEASDASRPIHDDPPEPSFVQPTQPGPRVVPLTQGQREIWIASQMSDEASCAFNEPASLAISGPLAIDRFVQAVVTVLAEQEAFRYRFDSEGESQWVDEQATFELPIIDWSEFDEVNRTARLDAWIDQASLTPFDLERGPLVRPQLFKLKARQYLFAIYCHHIIFDGFSSEILLRKIADAYGLVKDPASASFSTVPYSVYVERAALVDRDESAASLAYWCSEFEGSMPPPLELPTDRPRNSRRGHRAGTVHRKIDATLSLSLRDTAKALNTSVFVLLLSCFQALLSRLSSQEDIVIAVPMAGQARLNLWTVGYCVNALPLRVEVGHDAPFVSFVRETHRKMLDAFDHQAAALGEIVSALRMERDPSRLPLVEVFFNYSSYFSGLAIEGCSVTPRENPRLAIFYDMFLNITQWNGSVEIAWQYRSDLFDSSTIERWVEHYLELVQGVIADSQQEVGELPLMSTDQLSLAKAMWGGSKRDNDGCSATRCDNTQ